MITVLYQHNITGDTHDVTTLLSAAKWTTKRTGAPASFEITVLPDPAVVWAHGGIVAVKNNDSGLFYGYVVKIGETDKGTITVTCYDQAWYLKKNKETYIFTGQRADQILRRIANDFSLKLGPLANTEYVIPSIIMDAKTLFDIVLEALDRTLVNIGKMFVLWDDFGALTITDVQTAKLDLFLGDDSLVTSYSHETSIDSNTYNRIKLAQDNKQTGKRDVYIYQDSNNMQLWGILQEYKTVDEGWNSAQVKDHGDKMIEFYNRPTRKLDVTAISDLSVRAGRALVVGIKDINTNAFFVVDEASHDLIKGTMSLKLKVA